MNRLSPLVLLLALALALGGCSRLKPKAVIDNLTGPATLRVGVVSDAPPLAYKQNKELTGLEIRFAEGLAKSANKKLELVELTAADLAPALTSKKIDIAMAGLVGDKVRQQGLAASAPYLDSGQVILVRLNNYKRLGAGTKALKEKRVRIGVVSGSVGEIFVNSLKPKGIVNRYATAPQGVQALVDNGIDVFIHDLPSNLYYASVFVDKGLTPGKSLMTGEELVWAVRPDNQEMLQTANAYLAAIHKSGELQQMLDRAIPFYQNTAYSPKK